MLDAVTAVLRQSPFLLVYNKTSTCRVRLLPKLAHINISLAHHLLPGTLCVLLNPRHGSVAFIIVRRLALTFHVFEFEGFDGVHTLTTVKCRLARKFLVEGLLPLSVYSQGGLQPRLRGVNSFRFLISLDLIS